MFYLLSWEGHDPLTHSGNPPDLAMVVVKSLQDIHILFSGRGGKKFYTFVICTPTILRQTNIAIEYHHV